MKNILYIIIGVVVLTACSSTSSVPEDDKLFTGLRKTEYVNYEPSDHFYATQEEVEAALATLPNGALFGSPYYRMPSYRLWIYNALHKSEGGIGKWLRKTFGKAPVLLSAANPSLHSQVARELLRSRGYFSGYVNYDVLTSDSSRTAKVKYTVNLGELHTIDTLTYNNFPREARVLIDSTASEALVKKGDPFDVSTLEAERTRISTLLRNNGFFYYQPGYATYLADTIAQAGKAQVRLHYADSLPAQVGHKWYVGRINLEMRKNSAMEELKDTTRRRSYTIVYNGKREPMRRSVITRDMKLRPRCMYSYDDYLQTVNTLTAKGLFSRVDLSFAPRDTSATCDTLDLTLNCVFDKPYDIYVEGNVVGKTTGRVGPGVNLGFVKRNAFRGGEKLTVNLKGSYEWQTGHQADGSSSKFNSYEYGADISLEMPRLMFINGLRKRIRRMRRAKGKTLQRDYATPTSFIKASLDVLNRSGFFQRRIASGELTYTMHPKATLQHQFSPLILQFEYMQNVTDAFRDVLSRSPYLQMAMSDQFVPKMRYTLTKQSPATYHNPIFWQLTLSEASNILSLGYMAFGKKWTEKEKSLFKNPYAQFLKVETDFTKTWRIGEHNSLVGHVNAGVIWAYGNSESAPYSEQFYVGGANSIRAFNVRSIGPGKYYTDRSDISYLDQTGDIKFQANLEYRPRLFGSLYGALFLDAGNVWSLRKSDDRTGATFKPRNLLREMALGTGVGIRYDLDFFVLRLDWGVGLHLPYKHGFYNFDHFKDSQSIHFAIGYPF